MNEPMPQTTVIQLTSTVVQAPDLVGTSIEGQTALMSINSGAYYGMDPVGSRIWELLAQPRTVAAVVEQLLAEFAVDRPTCEAHVRAFLQKLADARLLQVNDAPAR